MQSVTVEGHYHGRNLHVQNSFNAAQARFCTTEIVVNGEVTNDPFDSSLYEIDLKARNLRPGDAVTVRIYHMDECGIRVLNPEVLAP
ncbi:MAG TPA: hypothetical protein VGQ36_27945 [Thermoanaerobaculia bacterium]|jgi:hypothetical protein|nr:hypothetical protein [Thermoanaerobaculia bacterium]